MAVRPEHGEERGMQLGSGDELWGLNQREEIHPVGPYQVFYPQLVSSRNNSLNLGANSAVNVGVPLERNYINLGYPFVNTFSLANVSQILQRIWNESLFHSTSANMQPVRLVNDAQVRINNVQPQNLNLMSEHSQDDQHRNGGRNSQDAPSDMNKILLEQIQQLREELAHMRGKINNLEEENRTIRSSAAANAGSGQNLAQNNFQFQENTGARARNNMDVNQQPQATIGQGSVQQVPIFHVPIRGNIELMLSKFDVGKGMKLEDFLKQFEAIATAQGANQTSFPVLLQKHLQGTAKTTFENIGGALRPYAETKLKMLQIFKDETDGLDNIDKLKIAYEREKGIFYVAAQIAACANPDKMGDLDYEHKLYLKISDILPVEHRVMFAKEACDRAISASRKKPNLDDANQAAKVVDTYIKNMSEIDAPTYAHVTRYERTSYSSNRKSYPKAPNKSSKDYSIEQKVTYPSESKKQEALGKKYNKVFKCFSCNKYGHIAKFCRNTKPSNEEKNRKPAGKEKTTTKPSTKPKEAEEPQQGQKQGKNKDFLNKFKFLQDEVEDDKTFNAARSSEVESNSVDMVQNVGSKNLLNRSNILKETKDRLQLEGKNNVVRDLNLVSAFDFYRKFEFRSDILCENLNCKVKSHRQVFEVDKNSMDSKGLQKLETSKNNDQLGKVPNTTMALSKSNKSKMGEISTNKTLVAPGSPQGNVDSAHSSLNVSYSSSTDLKDDENTSLLVNVNSQQGSISSGLEEQTDNQLQKLIPEVVSNDQVFQITKPLVVVDKLLTCDVNIGNCKGVTALIDAGSQATIVNEKLAPVVANRWSESPIVVSGAGANSRPWSTRVTKAKVSIAGFCFKSTEIYAVSKSATPYDLILGRDWLAENECQIDFANKTLSFIPDKTRPELRMVILLEDPKSPAVNLEGIPVYSDEVLKCVKGEPVTVKVKMNDYFETPIRKILEGTFKSNFKYDLILEIFDQFIGDMPNTVLLGNVFNEGVTFIAGDNVDIFNGQQLGFAYTCIRVKTREHYTILRDQELVDTLKNRPNKSEEPPGEPEQNAVLDIFEKYPENMPMEEVPENLRCADAAHIFPPRDMQKFDKIHNRASGHNVDRLEEGWMD